MNWLHTDCPQVDGGMDACMSGNAYARMSLALAITHLVTLIALLPMNNFSA